MSNGEYSVAHSAYKDEDITYVFGMAGLTGNTNLVASSIQYVSYFDLPRQRQISSKLHFKSLCTDMNCAVQVINVVMTIFALIFIDP